MALLVKSMSLLLSLVISFAKIAMPTMPAAPVLKQPAHVPNVVSASDHSHAVDVTRAAESETPALPVVLNEEEDLPFGYYRMPSSPSHPSSQSLGYYEEVFVLPVGEPLATHATTPGVAAISAPVTASLPETSEPPQATPRPKAPGSANQSPSKVQAEPAPQTSEPPKTGKGKAQQSVSAGSEMTVKSLSEKTEGDLVIWEGLVDATYGSYRVQADHVVYNRVTGDMTAEGNVIFDQGSVQRVTAERAEMNVNTRLGTFYKTTGFTNRTADGQYLYFTAERVDKTGPDTYVLINAGVTACENAVPKWSFNSKRTTLHVDDKVKLSGAVFKLKDIPAFYLPYATLPLNRNERKSGFLIPSTGSSTIKGRTFTIPYYQTLGRSADVTLRSDVFTSRGLGGGFDFRAQPDERSHFRLGSFFVKDRIFGKDGPNQGGSSFFANGVQYFPNGFFAVADVNITSSLAFRQIFSDDFEEIVNPEEHSILYIQKDSKGVSFDAVAQARQTTIFATGGFNPNIAIRQLPEFSLSSVSRPLTDKFPLYYSFEGAVGGLRRKEQVSGTNISFTPNVVQRFDFGPMFTFPLPSRGGWAFTPSVGFRTTFYSDQIDPAVPVFDPSLFTLDAADPRLDPAKPQFDPSLRLFSTQAFDRFGAGNLIRRYGQFEFEIRPPSLAKTYRHKDGSSWFKHVIEPYVTYRLIEGVGNFSRVPRFDAKDAVARTNEIEYSLVNRFFRTKGRKDGKEQPREFLSLKIAQKYFFDSRFGGALVPGERNQFFPINTLSGFTFGGIERRFSPVTVSARVRPVSSMFADVRLDYDTKLTGFRNFVVSGGLDTEKLSIVQSYFFTRRLEIAPKVFEPGTFNGNQWRTDVSFGNRNRGLYGGVRFNIDFVDRVIDNKPSGSRLINSGSYIGYGSDCCGVEVYYTTFNAGPRVESRFAFTFTLNGLGSLGNRSNLGQRGGRGSDRSSGKRSDE